MSGNCTPGRAKGRASSKTKTTMQTKLQNSENALQNAIAKPPASLYPHLMDTSTDFDCTHALIHTSLFTL